MEANTPEIPSLPSVAPKEREKKMPNVSLRVHFTAHATEEDIKGLEQEFADCDVFVPEWGGWSRSRGDRELLNDLTKGYLTPAYALRKIGIDSSSQMYGFWLRELEMMHDSQKPVTFVDIEETTSIAQEQRKSTRLRGNIKQQVGKNSSHLLSLTEEYEDAKTNELVKREENMAREVEPEIEKILEEYPHLKNKKDVKVLLMLGGMHTWVHHALDKEFQNVSRSFNAISFVMDYEAEAIRRRRFGKEVAQDLTAKVLLQLCTENFLFFSLNPVTRNSQKIMQYQRRILSKFSFDETKLLFEKAQGGEKLEALFVERLREKDILLPQSEAELDAFLARNKK